MPACGQAAESGCRAGPMLFIVLLPDYLAFALHLPESPPYFQVYSFYNIFNPLNLLNL